LLKNQQRFLVANFFATTEAPGAKPTNSYVEPCNTEALSKNQQQESVARLEACT